MTTWVTSDQHFYHARIINLCDRPFRDVTHMNETIINNHNAVVSPLDTVYMLGDFGMGDIDKSLEIVSRLNGYKTLVVGNHDRCFAGVKRSRGMTPLEWKSVYFDAGFEAIDSSIYLIDSGLLMSHFPYAGDSQGKDRYFEFRLPDEGITLLHGHTHSKEVISKSPAGTLQISVGVDANDFAPVDLRTIKTVANMFSRLL